MTKKGHNIVNVIDQLDHKPDFLLYLFIVVLIN